MTVAACGSDNNSAATSAAATGAAAAAADFQVDCQDSRALSAAGSSAQKNAMDQFTAAYIAACGDAGANLAYTASGSGDGRKQFIGDQVDFAGSDSAITGDQKQQAAARCGGEVWNLPMVFGPVALAYNLPGVDGLILDGPTAAKIFSGQVTTWNDPAIAALNPDSELPDTPIGVVYRSDSSGTTDNFQTYLEAASDGVWTKGAGSDFVGGVGNGSKGSAGVAQAVSAAEGSITYVEASFATQSGLQSAQIDSGAGPVELTPENAATAISQVEFVEPGGNDMAMDLTSIYGTEAPGAYPLVLATYEIVCGSGYDEQTAGAVKSFLKVAAGPGQRGLADIGYVPLPDDLRARLTGAIDSITAG
ncbi:phosphate ABC transporter substrate-binding protein PstS [Tomitella fengzijianii]|uniref:Phosphate-binding protein n=1 Tax=Tomitella fengzijianii TaxID=2597660 RepID=A0A516X7K9_9ACTN|nr:phosphate ABC transporter substrate-binding protein PstS [Tomitella fengzijianii]QDQ99057.1 phosphate ABC transporter substrate-binding protein PstS [Tomitella fengzijianii]